MVASSLAYEQNGISALNRIARVVGRSRDRSPFMATSATVSRNPTITVLADGRILVGWANLGQGASQSLRAQDLRRCREAAQNWTERCRRAIPRQFEYGSKMPMTTRCTVRYRRRLEGETGADKLCGRSRQLGERHATAGVAANLARRDRQYASKRPLARRRRSSLRAQPSTVGALRHERQAYPVAMAMTRSMAARAMITRWWRDTTLLHGRTVRDILIGWTATTSCAAGWRADRLDGGDDFDIASYAEATSGLVVDLLNAAEHR